MKPIQSLCTHVAALAMGLYFGLQVAGRLAYRGAAKTAPAWVDTVQTVGYGALAVFALALAGAVLVYRHRMQALGEWEADAG